MTFVTAKLLGVSGRGQLALVLSASSLVGALGFLSLQVGIVRAHHMGDSTAPRRGFMLAIVLALVVLASGSGIAFILPELRIGLFDKPTLLMVACGGALTIFNLVVLRTRQGLGDSRVFRDAWLIQSIIFPVLGIPVAIATHSPMLIVLCWFLALASSTTFALCKPVCRLVETPSIHVSSSEILTTSIAAHVGVMGQQLLHRADVVVLGLMASATTVGIYSIAAPIAGLLWVFSEALSLTAFDAGARRASVAQHRTSRAKLVRLNLVVGLAGAILIGLSSILLIPLLLPEYAPAVPLILILLPGVLIQGYARIGLSSILVSGTKRVVALIGASSALLSLLYIPFVYAHGAAGAAAASSTVYVLQTAVVIFALRRHTTRLELREANAAHK